MIKIAIIIGSTRPFRNAETVARWVYQIASRRNDAMVELVDLNDFNLPLLDEPTPAAMGQYTRPHTRAWAAKIASFDAYIFVTPEYNHAPSAALKNAIDYLYREWNNKAAGFVSYGADGGRLAVEHLRLIMGELQVADVQTQVSLSFSHDFKNYSVLTPRSHQETSINAMLDQLIAWGNALKALHSEYVDTARN
ncbi:NADPH-dependent FMN reductase [Ktedonospora formicarum]|uniref:FMN reductase n=1 Tax=Ktedonospora formicarum TaxID=2778364 RepID=A0A8J3HUC2_9CHLR|nr:NAD(P)H-dependent oxidoreductase [Ktedonospora formicarum]GHO42136.1 FMN reductase [Ktedonospora formicarum]